MSENHSVITYCFICGQNNDSFKYYGITDCNHQTCGTCAIKMSMFSTKCIDGDTDYTKCVFCKSETKLKFITTNNNNRFPSESSESNYMKDDEYGLIFEDVNAKAFFEDVVAYNCGVCYKKCGNKDELLNHMECHKKRYCELCLEFLKCLLREQKLYTGSDYFYHRNKEHPKCQFCNERFYDHNNVIKHVREKHFLCDICSRHEGFTAFNSHRELFQHYFKDHYVCDICRNENHINVFDTEQNLKLHRIKVHSKTDLVNEGVVTLSFSGSNNRNFSNRRRHQAAEQFTNEILQETDQPSNGSLQAGHVNVDALPPLECESEFPRLGDSSPRLGMISQTQDENDARVAFATGGFTNVAMQQNDKKELNNGSESKVPKQSVSGNARDSMANSLAHAVRMNSGRILDDEFPSLGDTVSASHSVAHNKSSATRIHQNINISSNSNALDSNDFPALSGSAKPSKPNWPIHSQYKKAAQSTSGAKKESKKPSPSSILSALSLSAEQDFPLLSLSQKSSNNKPLKWGSKASNSSKVSTAVTQPKEHVPQVSISKPNYVSNNIPANTEALKGINYLPSNQAPVKNSLRLVSDTSDFQTLKSTTASANNDANKPSSKNSPEFSLNKDFPSLATSLASSSKPAVSTWATKSTNNTKKNNGQKSANIAQKPKTNQVTMKKAEPPSEPLELSKPFYIPSNVPANADSLRGITYLPSAQAPVKNSLQLVDDIESLKLNTTSNAAAGSSSKNKKNKTNNVSLFSGDDFPDTLGSNHSNTAFTPNSINWSNSLSKNVNDENSSNSDEDNLKKSLNLENPEEFPDLGGNIDSSKQQTASKKKNFKNNQRKQKKNPVIKPEVVQEVNCQPEVSLGEIGAKYGAESTLINTYKKYSEPINCQERNNLLYEGMINCLGYKGAKLCLSVAKRFRKGLCDVEELIDVLSKLPISMLTEMIVLLPDIMLQQKLVYSLKQSEKSRGWADSACRELSNCSCCGQVLLMKEKSEHICSDF